jgi:hypothetical protein
MQLVYLENFELLPYGNKQSRETPKKPSNVTEKIEIASSHIPKVD